MSRFSNSIALAKASWQVLRADKELLVLPIISMIATVAAVLLFLYPVLATGWDAESFLLVVGLYFVLSFITIFFNAALVSAAHERLEGGDPTVRSALRGAASHIGRILTWALITAVVSAILRTIEERAGGLGRVVVGLVGMAWSVVTFLVLPIIVIEGKGAADAIRGSVKLFRDTWGENLGAQIGLGLIGFLAALPGAALIALGAVSGAGGLLAAGIGLGGLWILAVVVVMSTLSGILRTALYHYAAAGHSGMNAFDDGILANAFRPKKRGFGR